MELITRHSVRPIPFESATVTLTYKELSFLRSLLAILPGADTPYGIYNSIPRDILRVSVNKENLSADANVYRELCNQFDELYEAEINK